MFNLMFLQFKFKNIIKEIMTFFELKILIKIF